MIASWLTDWQLADTCLAATVTGHWLPAGQMAPNWLMAIWLNGNQMLGGFYSTGLKSCVLLDTVDNSLAGQI